jgi:SET domain-containing protein
VRIVEGRGLGLFTKENISAGEYVLEYGGELIPQHEGKRRERELYADRNASYLFYFYFEGDWWCRDSSVGWPCYGLGRYINHSKQHPNLQSILLVDDNRCARILFVSNRWIGKGSELLFDYGERDKEIVTRTGNEWLMYS